MIVADGVRNPWRFSFDRKNGDLWIGDVGQNSIEEVDHVAWPGGAPELRLERLRGHVDLRGGPLGPGRLVNPVAQYSHAARVLDHRRLRLPGRPCRPPPGATSTATTAAAPSGRSSSSDGAARQIRPEPFKVASLTSFGEDGAGELYAVSGEGTIYRLAS